MGEMLQAPAPRPPADPQPAAEPLFRPQVLAERQTQWLGTVLITPRPSYRMFSLFALATIVGLFSLLFFGSYAKKANVNGWLVPDQGVVRVFPAQTGVATEIFVTEGMEILRGQPLLTISTEAQSATLGDTQASIARGMAARRDSLAEEDRQNKRLLQQQVASLSSRLSALRSEQEQIKEEITLQQARLELAVQTERRQRELKDRGFISAQQAQLASEARLEQTSKLRVLERSRINLQRERLSLEGELKDLPLKSQAQAAAIARQIEEIGQELAEVEARRELIVPAPQSGTITAIQAESGGRVDQAVPLLTILPAGSRLEAHLYTASRAIGFVRAGQRVLLRYQAYAYQKFGHYSGVVANVSRSAISPRELPAQLAGLTTLAGTNEPVYRITVRLDRQTVTAYGEQMPLQPGMQLNADVVIEERRLIDWMLDPLYTVTGKLRG